MIEAKNLSRIPEIRHGFFTRVGGFSKGIYRALNCGFGSGDDADLVARNREIVTTSLGLVPHELVTVHQCHGTDVAVAREHWRWDEAPKADGLVSDRPHIAIAVATADCVPVLFADWKHQVVGAAHAGWRGALAGITDAVLAEMERLGARRDTTFAAVGPAISGAVYEVGPEVRSAFVEADAGNERFFRPSEREGHAMFDLPGYVVGRVRAGGLASVEHVDRCTYGEEEYFFSYRRATHRGEPDYGRQLSAITLGPEVFIEG